MWQPVILNCRSCNELVYCGNLDLERIKVCVDLKVMAQHLLCLFMLSGRGMSPKLLQETAVSGHLAPLIMQIFPGPRTGQYARVANTETNLNDKTQN